MKKMTLLFSLLIFCVPFALAQTKFYKYSGNPILEKGESGAWDQVDVGPKCVFWDGTKYHMWFEGWNGTVAKIGYAISADGKIWEKYEGNPVLEGTNGQWDAAGIGIYPSCVIFDGSKYMMYYIAYSGRNKVGLATSVDGIQWTKDTLNNPVLMQGETGTWDEGDISYVDVLYENSVYKMWYQAAGYYEDISSWIHKIGYAESSDGIIWEKYEGNPLIEETDSETWANDIGSPFVLHENNSYSMYYACRNALNFNDPYSFKYSTSSDGFNWNIDEDNPVLQESISGFDNDFIINPSVIVVNGVYKMWYTGVAGIYSVGYAEDFSNLVHADNVMIDGLNFSPGQSLDIMGHIVNPEGHDLIAKAMIVSDDGSIQDSVDLLDDGLNNDGIAGDGIYGGSYDMVEKTYTVGIKTVDEVTGFTRNGLNWSIIDRFTGKGPIELDHYEFESDITSFEQGKRAVFKLYLRNGGNISTVENVDVEMIIPEYSGIKETSAGSPDWGDIAPKEVKGNEGGRLAITIDDTCEIGEKQIILEISSNNFTWWYDTLTIDVLTSLDAEIENLPNTYSLEQNHPNPFNPITMINYSIPKRRNVTLKVFDALGSEVETLVQKIQSQGNYEFEFDGSKLSSGIYFYRLTAGDYVKTKKMILLK